MRCQECRRTGFRILYDDPRDPPLDTEHCLCHECYRDALEDEIYGMSMRVEQLKEAWKQGD